MLGTQLLNALSTLTGAAPQTATVAGDAGLLLELDLVAVESMSCAFDELRLHVPTLAGRTADQLKTKADELCKRVTYLLEALAPQEVDQQSAQVLVRSSPPDKQPGETRFYEVLLSATGQITLGRCRSLPGQPGRDRITIHLTQEVARKLVDDMVAAAA